LACPDVLVNHSPIATRSAQRERRRRHSFEFKSCGVFSGGGRNEAPGAIDDRFCRQARFPTRRCLRPGAGIVVFSAQACHEKLYLAVE